MRYQFMFSKIWIIGTLEFLSLSTKTYFVKTYLFQQPLERNVTLSCEHLHCFKHGYFKESDGKRERQRRDDAAGGQFRPSAIDILATLLLCKYKQTVGVSFCLKAWGCSVDRSDVSITSHLYVLSLKDSLCQRGTNKKIRYFTLVHVLDYFKLFY